MSGYVGQCHNLGFLCNWSTDAVSPSAAAGDLLQHINDAHGTGSTSPALRSLIEQLVTQTV